MMFEHLHENTRLQLVIGFLIGCCFGGFLYIGGGVTEYNVILGQLLLTDFTVIKVMLTAVVVGGMIGIYAMKSKGIIELHPKPGSIGSTVIGGIIFGMGFAILGYCPGTVAGAVGHGGPLMPSSAVSPASSSVQASLRRPTPPPSMRRFFPKGGSFGS